MQNQTTPQSKSQAVNWIVGKADFDKHGVGIWQKSIPSKMYSDITQHVRNLDTELKDMSGHGYLNWVEGGFWFEVDPYTPKPNTRNGDYRRNRTHLMFKCGVYEAV